jgi:glutathione S-transferase
MKLFDLAASPNCRKVRVIARELALPLEIVPIDLAETRRPDYLAHNPSGKVPTFVDDDGFVLWESGAILVHLAEKKPAAGLLPADAHARADVMRWLFFAATHIQPWLSVLGQERILKARSGQAPDEALLAVAERELARFLPIVEGRLADRGYLAGPYSIADIAVGCGLERCELRGLQLTPYPRLVAWRERLRARPAWGDAGVPAR